MIRNKILRVFLLIIGLKGSVMNTPFSLEEIARATKDVVVQQPQFIAATDNVALAYYVFLPKQEPQNIIIFYHGGGIWSNKSYQYMAQQCANQNIGVYLFDIRGHGNSDGPRGDAPSPQAVWDDVDTAIRYVHKKHPQAKLFLGGHSSGAGMVLNYTMYGGAQEIKNISGYLLLAPYLGPRSKANKEHKDSDRRFVKRVDLPKLLINSFSGGYFFEHSPVVFFNYPAWLHNVDTLVLPFYTCAMSKAISLHEQEKVFENINKPVAVFIGSEDEQFIPEAVIDYAKHCKHEKLITEIIPGSKHLSIVVEAAPLFVGALKPWGV